MADWLDDLNDKYLKVHGVGGALGEMRDYLLGKYKSIINNDSLSHDPDGLDQLGRMANSALAATLGTPGDLEKILGVQAPAGIKAAINASSGSSGRDRLRSGLAAAAAAHEPNIFPTTENTRSWLGVGEGVPEEIGARLGLPRTMTGLVADALHAATPGISTVARDIGEGYSRTMNAIPEPRGSGWSPGGSQTGAIKLPGGNWNEPDIDAYLQTAKTDAEVKPNTHIGKAVSDWLDKQGRRYIKNQFGTVNDPMATAYKDMPNLYGALGQDHDWVPEDYTSLKDMGKSLDDYGHVSLDDPDQVLPGPARRIAQYYAKHQELGGSPYLNPWNEMEYNSVAPSTVGEHLDNVLSRYGVSPSMWDIIKGNSTTKDPIDVIKSIAERRGYPLPEGMDWMLKADPSTPLYRFKADDTPLNVGTVANWAREALNATPGEHNPMFHPDIARELLGENNLQPDVAQSLAMHDAGLGLTPDQLARTSFVDASRKANAFADWLDQYKTSKNAGALASGTVVHKDYGDGMKWVKFQPDATAPELTLPDDVMSEHREGEGYVVRYKDQDRHEDEGELGRGTTQQQAIQDFYANNEVEPPEPGSARATAGGALATGLTAEGDAMGHCVGGYCPDVQSGNTEIYSLRDKNNQPHVTVEVNKPKGPAPIAENDWHNNANINYDVWDRALDDVGDANPRLAEADAGTPENQQLLQMARQRYNEVIQQAAQGTTQPTINQIKGKGNAAPVDKYLPYVHDFVNSQPWADVQDLHNTGLRRIEEYMRNPADRDLLTRNGVQVPRYVADEMVEPLFAKLNKLKAENQLPPEGSLDDGGFNPYDDTPPAAP